MTYNIIMTSLEGNINTVVNHKFLLQSVIPIDNDSNASIQHPTVSDDIIERPGSQITTMIDQNDDIESDITDMGSVVLDDLYVPDMHDMYDTTSLLKSTKIGVVDSIKKELLEEFSTMWSNLETPLNKSILVKILVRAMEIIEKTDITGRDQEHVIINVLVEILESDIVVSLHKEAMLTFLKEDAADVISTVVDASKGKININKLQGIVVTLFKKIGGCFA